MTLVLCTSLAALVPLATPARAGSDEVSITLVTHDSFAVSKSVLRAFTRETGIRVKVLPVTPAQRSAR
jgi:thiamine transport system substrate-binding protein